jgi:hypothetical protein
MMGKFLGRQLLGNFEMGDKVRLKQMKTEPMVA